MISEPKSQQINRRCVCDEALIDMPLRASNVGVLAGLGYGSYLGVKVTACDAAFKSACSLPLGFGFCPGDPCTLFGKSLQCFGIASGMSLAVAAAAGCGSLIVGSSYLAVRNRCSDPCDHASENCENHPVEVDGDSATPGTMAAGSSPSDNAPPAYEELIGPPPSYDSTQDTGPVLLTTWPASRSEN